MRSNGFKIGKIFGIEIFIDYSWFIIFVLITWLLAAQFFSSFNPQASILINIILGTITSLLFFASVLTHELAHSIAAKRNGIKVNRITLFLFGGISELFEEPTSAKTEFKVAIVGPLTSFLLAALFGLLYLVFRSHANLINFTLVFSTLAEINLLLGFFNLLPGFPLDGGRILRSIVWAVNKNLKNSTYIATLGGRIVAIIIVFIGILRGITTDFFGGVWLILIGLFLYQAAGQSYLELLIRLALEKVRIKEIMNPNIVSVSPFLTINDLIEEYFIKYNYITLPVIRNNVIVGTISLDDIRNSSEDLESASRVHEVMKQNTNNLYLEQEDKVLDALKQMVAHKVSFISVRNHDHDQLIGILTLDDIAKYLSDKNVI